MSICSNCQFENIANAEACGRCGHSLREEAGNAVEAVERVAAAGSNNSSESGPSSAEPIWSLPPTLAAYTPVPSHPNITVSVRGASQPDPVPRTVADPTPAPVWSVTPAALPEGAVGASSGSSTLRTRNHYEQSIPNEPVSTRHADSALAPKSDNTPPAIPVVRVRLVVLRGLRIGTEYPIYDGRNTIGRFVDKPVDIDLIAQESVEQTWCSRNHAVVTLSASGVTIDDLNSLNGTWVNGTRITPGHPRTLQVNDVIQIGTVQLKVLIS